ncbi:hypothetical protein Tsp_02900 [Trichinella spiralis]|uniref:hypothetical protein n=1 Tax=Trichinella spiralis TaxID=6334 RepID=UPI0001EFCB96|nr:hypothetical protein Tsp_02900 [Trichinella spiralis]
MCITVRQANAVNGRAVFISNSLASHVATEILLQSDSSVALTPSEVEMLKQFKDCDLPKGTRVGRMVMGDLGLYNEQLRKDVERWNKAIEAGIPVHEWNGTSDKILAKTEVVFMTRFEVKSNAILIHFRITSYYWLEFEN